MWLDRFSNQSSPSGAASPVRAYSPAPPRKSSYLAPTSRNGVNLAANRSTTSLDLSLNSSNLSLPLPNRSVNGSALRHEQQVPNDIEDPVNVLKGFLRNRNDGQTDTQLPFTKRAAPFTEQDIDFGGMNLNEYADHQIEDAVQTKYKEESSARISRQKFADFRTSIDECDNILNSVELYLTSFKAELGQVSAEIENLQARSTQLDAQLNNRREVEKLLGPAVEELSISPATVRSIADGPIDDVFGKSLTEIEARYLSIKGRHNDEDPNKVVDDVLPLLESLKTRAIERIRDYLVSQIKALRSPNTNAQIIQQQNLLRHKELYPYLSRNHQTLAEEIGQAYIYTMRWYFVSNFTRYRTALGKMQLFPASDSELLGSDPAATRKNALGGSKGGFTQHDPFSIGKRGDILKSNSDTAIPSYLAEDSKTVHHIETPFKSFNQALLDNASAEYSTVTEFFSMSSYHQVSRRVNEVFEPTFALGHDLTKSLVGNTTDCLGILICVRLNQRFAFETQKRKLPVLDSYINYTNILLWPRFQKIMDMHCESLQKVPTNSNRGAAAAFSLVGGTDASKASLAPHAMTQRFGQFLHGVLSLSTEAGDDEPVASSLGRLRTEYEVLMGKLAKSAGDAAKRARFLYNNYSLVLTIIGDSQGKLAEEQKEHFSALVRDYKSK